MIGEVVLNPSAGAETGGMTPPAAAALARSTNKDSTGMGLTPRQADALRVIERFTGPDAPDGWGSPSYAAIGAALGINKGGVARLLDGLVERGRIARQRIPGGQHGPGRGADNRAVRIKVLRPLPVSRAPDGEPLYFVRVDQ